MEEKIVIILDEMSEFLSVSQMSKSDLIKELVLTWLRIEEIESNRYYYE